MNKQVDVPMKKSWFKNNIPKKPIWTQSYIHLVLLEKLIRETKDYNTFRCLKSLRTLSDDIVTLILFTSSRSECELLKFAYRFINDAIFLCEPEREQHYDKCVSIIQAFDPDYCDSYIKNKSV